MEENQKKKGGKTKIVLIIIGVIVVIGVIGSLMNGEDSEDSDTKATTQGENQTEASTEPETKISDVAQESFFTYSGSGDDVVSGLTTGNSICCLKFTCTGDGHKAVKGHFGDSYDLLVNTTNSYTGYTLLYPNQEYTLEITAKGAWTAEALTIGYSTTDSFSGQGDWVSPIFIASSDTYSIVAEGGGHFLVRGYHNDGSYDLLVNTINPYSGNVMFKNKGEYSFFEITGERNWNIQPQ